MKKYQIQEFAQLAGVTIRTLRYYDQAGLLEPDREPENNHRVYLQTDLLRLQQVMALKEIGLTLAEIKSLLENQTYDVQTMLRTQKAALDARINQLQQASQIIEETLVQLGSTQEIDWVHVATIIHLLNSKETQVWLQQFFNDRQWQELQQRDIPVEEIREGEKAWTQLINDFRENCHLPPDHEEIQQMAGRIHDLIEAFTGGNPEIRAALESMYQNYEQMPALLQSYDADLQKYMNEALIIYERSPQAVLKEE